MTEGGRVFDRWLQQQPVEQPEGTLTFEALTDAGWVREEELLDQLGREVARNYVGPGELAFVFDDLGAPEVADYLRTNKFPARTMTRHGDFGEIVTGALYRRVRRWCVPVLKLRYKQTAAQAVQGTDVLAFRFRDDPPVVAVAEVKTRSRRDKQVASEASESLEKVLERLDESLAFLMARCADRQHFFLARHLGALQRPGARRKIHRHIVFVHDADKWNDDMVTLVAGVVTQPTELTAVKIKDLKEFVARVYWVAEAGLAPRTHGGEAA
ncbi:Hachiman antiphage defense system protein HamA [Streptomyces sp. RPT161]|uniref:Hachiman antiphage defense system protein HamA n=1 Tax=Streptomyces sp. RPT161 TaxID=3015993 RepID=UPI0022B8E4E0|nr:Hachiman antiphage defense system protein HamA [Streptomyces sp. RPT161]